MSLIRKHGAVLQAWACLALVLFSSQRVLHLWGMGMGRILREWEGLGMLKTIPAHLCGLSGHSSRVGRRPLGGGGVVAGCRRWSGSTAEVSTAERRRWTSTTAKYSPHSETSSSSRYVQRLAKQLPPNLHNFVKCTYESVTRELRIVS